MELMGTEGAPDGFVNGGAFPMPDLAEQIRSGFYTTTSYESSTPQVSKHSTVLRLPVSERSRLTKSKPVPDLRYHYRVIAAALAIDAAKLLPNDSEELADVVNCAGLWVKDEEEKLGNRYFSILQNRAARSAIGRAATARRWFVDQPGPWSLKEKQTEEKMRQELKIPAEN
jgi:hypothetical protein